MALPQRAEQLQRAASPPEPKAEAWASGREAYQLLRVGFAALPILAGADKFFNVLGPWRSYLASEIPDLLGVSSQSVMHAVGALEILAGLMVIFRPSVGGWLVAVWLWAIVGNLLILPGYYDVALRDLALSLGAIALARLAQHFGQAGTR